MLRALAPDPQLHRRLRQSEFELFVLQPHPPLHHRLLRLRPRRAILEYRQPPPSRNRSRHTRTVAGATPCRRAAADKDSSPASTASTTCTFCSPDNSGDALRLTHVILPRTNDPARKFDSLDVIDVELAFD